jgi:hypothetical protein
MKPMAPKYMFVFLRSSTVFWLVISLGFGAPGADPSCGTVSREVAGGDNWAEPKMYGKKA